MICDKDEMTYDTSEIPASDLTQARETLDSLLKTFRPLIGQLTPQMEPRSTDKDDD